MRRHLLRFPGIERRCAHFSRLGEEDVVEPRAGCSRGGPAHPSTILSKVSGTAATHPQAGAARPRGGPREGVRLTA